MTTFLTHFGQVEFQSQILTSEFLKLSNLTEISPECLQSQLDVVSFLGHGKVLELSQTGVVALGVVPPLSERPAGLDLAHRPHLVDVLGQLVLDVLHKGRKLDLRNDRPISVVSR